MISDRMDINRVLSEMRAIKTQTQFPQMQSAPTEVADSLTSRQVSLNEGVRPASTASPFGQLMHQAIDNVNGLQHNSKQMAASYERGQSGVDITDVMVASQKASVSFQAMVQVRNKLVEAYKDVMNMPV